MTEEKMRTECFGGTYKVKKTGVGSSLPEERTRYWNAYMLFYESRFEGLNSPCYSPTSIFWKVKFYKFILELRKNRRVQLAEVFLMRNSSNAPLLKEKYQCQLGQLGE